MKPTACPSHDELSAFVLGKLPEDLLSRVAEHSGRCGKCQKILQGLDATADPMVQQIRKGRAQAGPSPALAPLLKKAEAISVASHGVTVSTDDTMGGQPQLTQDLRAVLAPPQGPGEMGRLGRYRVIKLLGHGGMGMVFQAEDPGLQRTVALKVMLPSVAANAAAKERFLREARATAAIEHDHIVTIYEAQEDRGVAYLAMQFLKGMSLEDYIKKAKETNKPFTLGQILKLGREIARGLAAAHERGLIHRDIKPANIWLDATAGGRAKILDFGLARPAATDSNITQSGMIVGTPAYMAPEQATGQKIDGRVDLFSLGVALYRLCSGRLPWKGETAMATLMAVATEETTPLAELCPKLPPALPGMVMKLLAKKPDDRPKSAKAVVEAIIAIEKEAAGVKVAVPVSAQPNAWQMEQPSETAALVKAPAPKRTRRWLPFVAAVLLLGGGVALYQVIIRVETKDGKTAEVKVPDKSTVTVKDDGKIIVEPPAKAAVGQGRGVTPEWIATVQKLPAEKQVEAVAAKLKELNPGFEGNVEPTIERGTVSGLKLVTDQITDISPVVAMRDLRQLVAYGPEIDGKFGKLKDLSPLQGLKLEMLDCGRNPVSDLTPLHGMPLTEFLCGDSQVTDLTPLKDMRLTRLAVNAPGVPRPVDLTPIRGMPLTVLYCRSLTPQNLEIMRSIPTLTRINFVPPTTFWKDHDARYAAFLEWIEDTRKLQAEKQVAAVTAKLKELNPQWDGKVTPLIDNRGRVRQFKFHSKNVNDISPLRALADLKQLDCAGTQENRSSFFDLSPVRGMELDHVNVTYTRVKDLSPLRGMSTLIRLYCNDSLIDDLTPVAGLPIQQFHFFGTGLKDYTLIRQMPLKEAWCDDRNAAQLAALAAIPTLEKINNKPAAEVLGATKKANVAFEQWIKDTQKLPAEKQVEAVAAKLKELNPSFDGTVKKYEIVGGDVVHYEVDSGHVTDITPVRAFAKLTWLECVGPWTGKTGPVDLTPLAGMKLTRLSFQGTQVRDLTPLRGMPVTHLNVGGTAVADLTPLAGMPLTYLLIHGTKVTDLSPLKGLPLTDLWLKNTQVKHLSAVQGMPLVTLVCSNAPIADLTPLRNATKLRHLECNSDLAMRYTELLRSIKTLEKINGTPAAVFWKEVDTKKP